MATYKTVIIDNKLEPKPAGPDVLLPAKPVRNLLWEFAKKSEDTLEEDRKHVKDKTPALGSDENVHCKGNFGFFSAVIEAYNNHWTLEMRPEDWFYTFVQKIALAIDRGSKTDVVRNFFVDHEDKKTLTVNVSEDSPMDVDYSWFLDQMTRQIDENIKTANFVDLMTANFSTSTKTDRIVSSITTMMSVQEFFEYRMMCGCGIPAVAMRGTEDDWIKLQQKLKLMENLLAPIKEVLNQFLPFNWWRNIETICHNLIKTYRGDPDLTWWHSIIMQTEGEEWGPSGMGPARKFQATAGWFLKDLLGLNQVKHLTEIDNPLVTVPMKIDKPGEVTEEATFVGGISGYKTEKAEGDTWPRVSSVHSWTLLLEPHSVYRQQLKDWEDKISGA
eukprot:GFUD01016763.1.p1 GENE.GFUD01016763.1~~GFUD01016763.1.p1  ORF type:complete len:387 (+),score=114.21 GFUD01016763.1:285-1445(+)